MAELRVHLLDTPAAEEMDALRAALSPGIEVTAGAEPPGPASYDILVGGRPKREHLSASARLKAVIIPFAGVPEATRQLLGEFPHLAVHNLHHNAATTAEFALGLLLAAAKLLVPADQALRRHDWSIRYQRSPSLRLAGRTALILGYGHIGQRVARACAALGMQVRAVKRQAPDGGIAQDGVRLHPASALPQLLREAQAVVITLPLTPATRGLLGANELALLPPEAILVNVGRAEIVDEAGLYEALRLGRLRAGLDVWYQYPTDEASRAHTPPARFPFGELDNVVLSPHRAGSAQDSERQRLSALAELVNAATRGEAMPNRVDAREGY